MGLSTKGPISKWEGSWAQRSIREAGARAYAAGVPYHANPYDHSANRLAWSEGHNNARIAAYMLKETRS
ncbi:hypothetical protein [Rhizobium phage RHph_X66]|nr:hypothetical protein [Rhizobium phage RHph_X66]